MHGGFVPFESGDFCRVEQITIFQFASIADADQVNTIIFIDLRLTSVEPEKFCYSRNTV